MESGTHMLSRTMAAPVTIDFIPPACLLKFPLLARLGEWALPFRRAWLLLDQSAPAHPLSESCDPSSPEAFLFPGVRELPGWRSGWGWTG